MTKKIFTTIITLFITVAAMAETAVKNGDAISFLGDSITYYGNRFEGGYVNLVIAGLKANGIDAVKLPAGISGHKSNQMLARLEQDVLAKKPQIMTLSCGVNDVWHGKRGVKLPEYKKNITELIDKAQAAGVKVCILTATMITENPDAGYNLTLASYNDFLRQLAREKGCMLADLNAVMQKEIAAFKAKYPDFKGNLFTNDGVHMNPNGNELMAEGVLRAFGLDDAQIAKAKSVWHDKYSDVGRVLFSGRMIRKIAPLAAEKGVPIQEYLAQMVENLPEK